MWHTLYERLRQAQNPQAARSAPTEREVVHFRHPPTDEALRCPHCTGVRLVPTDDPDRMRCVWCTRVYDRAALEAA